MSTTLWKINPEKLCTVTDNEINQILLKADNSDVGTYYLDAKILKTLKRDISAFTFCTLQKEIKANGSIEFIIG